MNTELNTTSNPGSELNFAYLVALKQELFLLQIISTNQNKKGRKEN